MGPESPPSKAKEGVKESDELDEWLYGYIYSTGTY
jgi:hypothetical protein